MFVIFVFLLIVLILLMPYLQRAFKRLRFFRSLKKKTALKKYRIKLNTPISSLLCNLSDSYDITVDTGRRLYAIKFWDEFYKNSNIIFNSKHQILRRRKISEFFSSTSGKVHKSSEQRLGELKLSDPEINGKREIKRVFIVSPKDLTIFFYDGKEISKVDYGSSIYGMTVCSYKNFFSFLKI